MLTLLERRLVFPAPRAVASQVDATVFAGEDVFLISPDGTALHGWYFPHDNPVGYLLYCHGNGIMVPQLGNFASGFRDKFGYAVFVFDYRGYGLSKGKPDERGVLQDAHAARNWLLDREGLRPNQIVLMGSSLGGAIAVDLAAHGGARGLVLQNTFSSMLAAAAHNYPWLPVRTFIRTKFPSIDLIENYHGPLLQSHGTADRTVPLRIGEELFDAANEPKQFLRLDQLDHHDPHPPKYYQVLAEFLESLGRS